MIQVVGWQVTLELISGDELDKGAARLLEQGLPPGAMAQRTSRGVSAVLVGVDRASAGQALDHALEVLQRAVGAAGLPSMGLVAGEVVTAQEAEDQVDRPRLPPIVGLVDAAHLLGVSRQRVHQLVAKHPHFPPPAAHTSATPVWTRASIEAFQRDHRRPKGSGASA